MTSSCVMRMAIVTHGLATTLDVGPLTRRAEKRHRKSSVLFMSGPTTTASSCADIIQDIVRLIAPEDRSGFNEMLARELRGRELPDDKIRRVAVNRCAI